MIEIGENLAGAIIIISFFIFVGVVVYICLKKED